MSIVLFIIQKYVFVFQCKKNDFRGDLVAHSVDRKNHTGYLDMRAAVPLLSLVDDDTKTFKKKDCMQLSCRAVFLWHSCTWYFKLGFFAFLKILGNSFVHLPYIKGTIFQYEIFQIGRNLWNTLYIGNRYLVLQLAFFFKLKFLKVLDVIVSYTLFIVLFSFPANITLNSENEWEQRSRH